MANYNTGKLYNFTIATGGTKYDSAQFFILVNLFETMRASDDVKERTVRNILNETANVFLDSTQYALMEFSDELSFSDESSFSALQALSEKFHIKETLEDVIVALYLKEKYKALDEIKALNTLISQQEESKWKDIGTLDVLIKKAEEASLSTASKLLADIKQYEQAIVTDRAPRKAISEFVIGSVEGLDRANEYFSPLNMIFDPDRSSIQVMPQTETTYIEMPYTDGSIPENTVYKNRFFNIVAWSQDGLTTAQKEQLKLDITRVLDSTKNKPKKMTFQKANVSFDVMYSGSAEVKEGPSFVKATLPFEASPYGYPLFDQIIYGSGLIMNRGVVEVGAVNEVSGGCVNPSFQIGSIKYEWAGTVPVNSKLVIDHEALMCYLEDTSGKRQNALTNLTGEFQTIPAGKSVQITASENTKNYLRTSVKEKILWSN